MYVCVSAQVAESRAKPRSNSPPAKEGWPEGTGWSSPCRVSMVGRRKAPPSPFGVCMPARVCMPLRVCMPPRVLCRGSVQDQKSRSTGQAVFASAAKQSSYAMGGDGKNMEFVHSPTRPRRKSGYARRLLMTMLTYVQTGWTFFLQELSCSRPPVPAPGICPRA